MQTENVTNIVDEMEIEDFVFPVNEYEGDFITTNFDDEEMSGRGRGRGRRVR